MTGSELLLANRFCYSLQRSIVQGGHQAVNQPPVAPECRIQSLVGDRSLHRLSGALEAFWFGGYEEGDQCIVRLTPVMQQRRLPPRDVADPCVLQSGSGKLRD